MIYIDAAVGNGVPNFGVQKQWNLQTPFSFHSFLLLRLLLLLHFHELHHGPFNFDTLKSSFIWIRMLPRHTYWSPFLWQALIWTDVYSYAAFSRGASGLLDTMIHCMRGIVSQMGGFSGPIGYSAVLVQEPGARSREPGAGSSSGMGLGFFYKLFSEGYY